MEIAATVARLAPLAIHELRRRGGPSPDDWAWALNGGLAGRLGTEGDLLLGGQHSPLMGEIVRAVSILAFLPGGVRLFGGHYQAEDVVVAFPQRCGF